jgi:small-conductance mechanosensitive channel
MCSNPEIPRLLQALFLSLSSIILGFAFMIGGASAKYFEGILFILVRRPYDIGDRIHVSPIDSGKSIVTRS